MDDKQTRILYIAFSELTLSNSLCGVTIWWICTNLNVNIICLNSSESRLVKPQLNGYGDAIILTLGHPEEIDLSSGHPVDRLCMMLRTRGRLPPVYFRWTWTLIVCYGPIVLKCVTLVCHVASQRSIRTYSTYCLVALTLTLLFVQYINLRIQKIRCCHNI